MGSTIRYGWFGGGGISAHPSLQHPFKKRALEDNKILSLKNVLRMKGTVAQN